jgi:uncharacterized protein involved in exopolysaccharide biosynthesis
MITTADPTADGQFGDPSRLLSPKFYLGFVRRRLLYFLVPFVLLAAAGVTAVVLLPAIYLSEGKILIESQQIPSELVRPTVTTLASERIQIIEQRLMTRDNIMGVVDKFKLFADRRSLLSATELIDLVRERTSIKPIELGQRRPGDKATVAFTVGFEHEKPDIAAKVANEFITLLLNEDLRNRSNRASETTKFLAREVKRLQTELGSIEGQIGEIKKARSEARSAGKAGQNSNQRMAEQLGALKAEFLQKAAQYSPSHPDLQALNRKIAALEKLTVETTQAIDVENGLDSLERQHEAAEKNLAEASQKLSTARLGETLERDQQSERLEVIEQPTTPQDPIKPKKGKLLIMALALAFAGGAGLAVATEALDSTIRTRADLLKMVDSSLLVPIPMILSQGDRIRQRQKAFAIAATIVLFVAGAAAVAYFFLPPLDIALEQALIRFPRYFNK